MRQNHYLVRCLSTVCENRAATRKDTQNARTPLHGERAVSTPREKRCVLEDCGHGPAVRARLIFAPVGARTDSRGRVRLRNERVAVTGEDAGESRVDPNSIVDRAPERAWSHVFRAGRTRMGEDCGRAPTSGDRKPDCPGGHLRIIPCPKSAPLVAVR
jgi:hypothetical protein